MYIKHAVNPIHGVRTTPEIPGSPEKRTALDERVSGKDLASIELRQSLMGIRLCISMAFDNPAGREI